MSQVMNTSDFGRSLPQFRSTALIAAGSNTRLAESDLSSTIDTALQAVGEKPGMIRAVSRYFSTPAFPAGSGPDFVNAAFVWATDLPAADILQVLHDVERALGRVRADRWGARTMDLDLIAVENQIYPDRETLERWMDMPLTQQQARTPDQLLLPHPRVQDRAFVLVPLCDVAPDWRHPLLGKTASELCAALPHADRESVIPLENHPKRP